MEIFDPLVIALVLIVCWILLLIILAKKKILERFNMALMGPFLMWRTVRGRQFLDRLARPKRFWRMFGNLAIILSLIAMVALMALLLWQATLVPLISPENAPSPELIIGVPGLNPIIPIWYGILGLAIAIVFHEFLHGILARVADVPLKSMGILLFIFPVGAFVEPDEDELGKLTRPKRARMFAAGPAINMIVAVVFAVLFSTVMMSSVRPAHEGVGITEYTLSNSPAEQGGLVPGMIIFSVNNTPVSTLSQFIAVMENTAPGQIIEFKAYFRGIETSHNVTLIESSDGRAIMGVRLMSITTAYFHPIGGTEYFGSFERSFFSYLTLPFLRIQPTQEPLTDFFVIEGAWGAIPESVFWVLANSFYWVFWINAMLGATNALPAVPLDGGYIFRDGLNSILERGRKRMTPERREKVVRNISYALAILILFLVLMPIIVPRLL